VGGRADRAWLVAGCALVAAAALAGCGGHGSDVTACSSANPSQTLVYDAHLPSGTPPSATQIDTTVARMCRRLGAMHLRGVGVQRAGANEIEVRATKPLTQAQVAGLVRRGQLRFYDWEPNVIGDANTPLPTFYAAVKRAARSGGIGGIGGIGGRYYLFGRDHQVIPPGETRSPAGRDAATAPGEPGAGYESCAVLEQDLRRRGPGGSCAQQPAGETVLRVPRGTAVVKAPMQPGYYVIRDRPEFTDSVTHPQQEFDPQTNEPIVTFKFTDKGRKAFARATKREAERGAQLVRPPGTPIESTFQRFAIALDNQIVSLATVSYRDNPEGIDGQNGAQINGIGNIQDTQNVTAALRVGALPVELRLVSAKP
jgi:SecD/SecF fusion protein